MSTMLERRYRRQHLNCVRHITLDPKGRGVVRIHMIPPREDAENAPFLLLLNGSKLVPLNLSWAILLSCFMDRLEPFAGLEITESDWNAMAAGAVARTHKVYPFTPKERLAEDLQIMIESLVAIARGQEPEAEVAPLTLGEYAPEMTAPHRMDLMVSAMTRDGAWHCNQKCLHCYAAGQPLSDTPELTTAQWKEVLNRLRAANIPQVTFTGGEPTLAFGLETLMARIKEMGYLVKLDTNGCFPEHLKKLYFQPTETGLFKFHCNEKKKTCQFIDKFLTYGVYLKKSEVKVLEVKEISQAVIGRLPRYFRYLGELKDEGVERISSQELSGLMKVTASQIRQDFNNFGGFGQQGYGYNVESLYREIGKILGLDKQHNFVIIGAGNLGRALGNYMNFERRGFIFKGMFDANPELVGKDVRGVKVMPMDQLESFIRENDIDIAVLTIPKTSAVEVADKLVANGIRAIWNFAHVDLNVPEGIQVENVHLSDSLMKLSYNINRYSSDMK